MRGAFNFSRDYYRRQFPQRIFALFAQIGQGVTVLRQP
jgi:hypothetical protein